MSYVYSVTFPPFNSSTPLKPECRESLQVESFRLLFSTQEYSGSIGTTSIPSLRLCPRIIRVHRNRGKLPQVSAWNSNQQVSSTDEYIRLYSATTKVRFRLLVTIVRTKLTPLSTAVKFSRRGLPEQQSRVNHFAYCDLMLRSYAHLLCFAPICRTSLGFHKLPRVP